MRYTPNELTDKFNDILNDVCGEFGMTWYDVMETPDAYEEVKKRCLKLCKKKEDKGLYRDWESEVMWDI